MLKRIIVFLNSIGVVYYVIQDEKDEGFLAGYDLTLKRFFLPYCSLHRAAVGSG